MCNNVFFYQITGDSALAMAAIKGYKELVKILLSNSKINVNLQDISGKYFDKISCIKKNSGFVFKIEINL